MPLQLVRSVARAPQTRSADEIGRRDLADVRGSEKDLRKRRKAWARWPRCHERDRPLCPLYSPKADIRQLGALSAIADVSDADAAVIGLACPSSLQEHAVQRLGIWIFGRCFCCFRSLSFRNLRFGRPWPHSRSHFTKKLRRGIFEKTEGSACLLTTSVRESHGLVFNVPCMERGRSRNFLNLARSCCLTKTCARVDLSLNFGLAAKAPNVMAVTDATIPIFPTQTTCQWEGKRAGHNAGINLARPQSQAEGIVER
jgi:hypothetical protein